MATKLKVYKKKKTTLNKGGKDKFSEIQLCGKKGVNREKEVSIQTSSACVLNALI